MKPQYDLEKIKLGIDEGTWKRAVALYESNAVENFRVQFGDFFAKVIGGEPYNVFVSSKVYDEGNCNCYLGRSEILCKHMVAVAIYAVKGGRKLTKEEKELSHQVVFSGLVGELTELELTNVKTNITASLKYIKSYHGPSRSWFQYQNSLTEGCNRLAKIVSGLPICPHTSSILVDLLLRADKKLTASGIDDSDGIVGAFIEAVVLLLMDFSKLDKNCIKTFSKLVGKETCFGWESPLLEIYDSL
ncbi:MAG: hypothetical protein NTY30_03960 [Candidatus Berkelbacteria bacterium]|nr:hypothetical protein [Candidatus Berkelbacteria bacterium]